MAGTQETTNARPSSCGSPVGARSPDGGLDGSTASDSDVLSVSLTGTSKKQFMMLTPEEKLEHFDRRARAYEDNQEYDACIQDLVRCVALTRLVHGMGHLKLAEAHVRLAKAYLLFKGFGPQAQKHLVLAREMLPLWFSCREEKLEVLTCLLSIHLTHGAACVNTAKYPDFFQSFTFYAQSWKEIPKFNTKRDLDNFFNLADEAEASFLEAGKTLEELHQQSSISLEEKTKTELEIFTGLYRVYKTQNRAEDALSQCESSLRLLTESGQLENTCSIYRDMATIERGRGRVDRAIELLSKAHAAAMSHSPEQLEGAQISHSLALLLSSAAEPHYNESAGHYFELSLNAYKSSTGPHDPDFLAVQDDFCRHLLSTGQQKRCVKIQRASLASKRSTFGDLSAQVADTLQLIGSLEMSGGSLKQAHRTLMKCLEIQHLLYGAQHKKTKATQKAVDMLSRAPQVAKRQQSHGRKSKADTCTAVAPTEHDDDSNSDS